MNHSKCHHDLFCCTVLYFFSNCFLEIKMSVMTTSNTSSVLKGIMEVFDFATCTNPWLACCYWVYCFCSVSADVVAYVDVWSSEKRANYSNIFIQQLEEIGAEVKRLFRTTVFVQLTYCALIRAYFVDRCHKDLINVSHM